MGAGVRAAVAAVDPTPAWEGCTSPESPRWWCHVCPPARLSLGTSGVFACKAGLDTKALTPRLFNSFQVPEHAFYIVTEPIRERRQTCQHLSLLAGLHLHGNKHGRKFPCFFGLVRRKRPGNKQRRMMMML
ncbi:cortexin-2 isoform X1 [Macaca nemestrina]|uniref:cortexin-2 isoform X1 n=1 Tax=Macaca nemestrina TaxID=9545 RepID=UPI0039B9B2F7